MTKPNILFFMCDQLRADVTAPDHPCQTPNMDTLTTRGMRFAKAYTPNPVCSPARASLMTGLLPHNHGVTVVTHTVDDDQACLRTDKAHWAQHLAAAGYRTGYFGKWHIERTYEVERFGWQEHRIFETDAVKQLAKERVDHGEYVLSKYNEKPEGYEKSLLYGVTEADPSQRMFSLAIDGALGFLQSACEEDRPWCCFVSLTEPHDPFVCSKEAFDQYDVDRIALPDSVDDTMEGRPYVYKLAAAPWQDMTDQERREAIACYWASVTDLDVQLGRLLQTVEESGQLDNTIVVLTSDHGEHLGAHGLYCKNFHAGEEVYNVPLIMAGPGVPEAVVTDARVGTHDLCPTLLQLTDCEPIAVPDSRSFAPLLTDPSLASQYTEGYAEYSGGRMIITQRVVWDQQWKFVCNGFDRSELYDLASDPSEMVNLIDDPRYDDILRHMCKLLWRKIHDTGDHSLWNSHYPILRLVPYGPGILDSP